MTDGDGETDHDGEPDHNGVMSDTDHDGDTSGDEKDGHMSGKDSDSDSDHESRKNRYFCRQAKMMHTELTNYHYGSRDHKKH